MIHFFYTSLISETPCFQCGNPVKTINQVLCTLHMQVQAKPPRYETFIYFCSDRCKELYELSRG